MHRRILVTFPLPEPDRELLVRDAAGREFRFATVGNIDDRSVAWADTIFGNVRPPDMLARHPNVRWLHSPNVGLDDYSALVLARPDLRVTNAKGIADEAVSDHALAMLLAMTRAVPLMVADRQAKDWSRPALAGAMHRPLSELEIHILGFGTIGRCLVRKLRGFGSRVTIYRRQVEGEDPKWGRFVRLSRLAECVGGADAIVNLLPSVPETKHCIDGRVLSATKPGALFVNVGRGATVDEAELVKAVEGKRLGGAALDVFEAEPLPSDSPLWTLPDVIISPHVGGRFQGEAQRQVRLFLELLGSDRV